MPFFSNLTARKTSKAAMIVGSLMVFLLPLSGCTVQRFAKGAPGDDVSAVRPGVSRSVVEQAIGSPLREWQSVEGVTFCIYQYRGPLDGTADALTFLFLDVISLGLIELFSQSLKPSDNPTIRPIISYDRNGHVLGIFGEKDNLPPDGRLSR